MNILFLSINFNAEVDGIYTDLMKELRNQGNNIYSVSAIERRNKLNTFKYEYKEINILKVKTLNIQKTNFIEKGISTLLIENQFIKAIKKYYSNIRFDLVIYATPPITFEKVIKYIKNRDKAKSYLLLKDIFPQNAVDLDMIKKDSIIYRFFRKKEEELYKNSDFIGCMSKKNKEYLLQHNSFLHEENVQICPNSIKIRNKYLLTNLEKEKIKEKFNISKEKILLLYGGNLGKPQGIDFLVDVLKSNKHNDKLYFFIVGDGTEYKKLEKIFEEENFKNAMLKNRLPKEDYDKIVQCADLGLIFLDRRFTIPNFPSRLLSYMEYSIPVIASTDINTDIGEVIINGKFGYWCKSGDLEEFSKILDDILENKENLISLGKNARDYLESNYTVDKCSKIILNNF